MLTNSIAWLKSHKGLVATIGFILILGAALGFTVIKQLREVENRGWELLAVGQYLAAQNKYSEAHGYFSQLFNRYQQNKIADFAYIHDATIHAREGNWRAALENYEQILTRRKSEPLLALAQLGKAKMQEALNDLPQAQASYEFFLERYGQHFSAPEAYEGLARVYMTQGKIEQSKENLERLKTLYPETSWAKRAEIRVRAMMPSQNK